MRSQKRLREENNIGLVIFLAAAFAIFAITFFLEFWVRDKHPRDAYLSVIYTTFTGWAALFWLSSAVLTWQRKKYPIGKLAWVSAESLNAFGAACAAFAFFAQYAIDLAAN